MVKICKKLCNLRKTNSIKYARISLNFQNFKNSIFSENGKIKIFKILHVSSLADNLLNH